MMANANLTALKLLRMVLDKLMEMGVHVIRIILGLGRVPINALSALV